MKHIVHNPVDDSGRFVEDNWLGGITKPLATFLVGFDRMGSIIGVAQRFGRAEELVGVRNSRGECVRLEA